EQVGSLLGTNFEYVPEASARDQQARSPFALQQSICRDGGAHAHLTRNQGLIRAQSEHAANRVDHRCIARQHFRDGERTRLGVHPDAVREGTAAIDPNLVAHHEHYLTPMGLCNEPQNRGYGMISPVPTAISRPKPNPTRASRHNRRASKVDMSQLVEARHVPWGAGVVLSVSPAREARAC